MIWTFSANGNLRTNLVQDEKEMKSYVHRIARTTSETFKYHSASSENRQFLDPGSWLHHYLPHESMKLTRKASVAN